MSADVQPRKRKDKKRKRDSLDSKSEGEIITRKLSLKDDEDIKESHHGVHATKMGDDDVHLHVQGEHSTGGHWCAKLFFFSLLAILLGLIGLIIMEHRGLSDLDTPLSESRFSEYFDGWVDEHRESHDDHVEKIPAELEDHDAEPFEEEEDHSEGEDDEEHDEHAEQDDHDEKIGDEGIEEDDDVEETAEDMHSENVENDEDGDERQHSPDDEDDDIEDDEDEVEEVETPSYSRNSYMRAKREIKDEDEEDVDEGFDENEDIDDSVDDNVNNDETEKEQAPSQPPPPKPADEQDPYEEIVDTPNTSTLKKQVDELYDIYHEIENALNANQTKKLDQRKEVIKTNNSDVLRNKRAVVVDDDDFESLENVVYNDADEDLHLQQKAKQQQELTQNVEEQEDPEPESSSLALKVFVGVALAFVARLVLIKNTDTSTKHDSIGLEDEIAISMRRRLTMVSTEEPIPSDHDEHVDDLGEEYLEEEEDDEVECSEEEEVVVEKYVPESFEQLNAMYRPKATEYSKSSGIEELRAKVEDIKPKLEDVKPKIQEIKQAIEEIKPQIDDIAFKSVELKPEMRDIVKVPTQQQPRKEANILPAKEELHETKHEEGDDEEELSEGEEEEEPLDEEELGSEEEEVSDVDDDDLMKRLEAKYGKLPQRHYDSEEEDEDIGEDNSWTKIKSRPGGGPQSYSEEDYIEEQLRRANEEMLQNNIQTALKIFENLSLKYPDIPGALYGKAKALDRLSEQYQNNQILIEAIMAYKRFLALDDKIDNSLFKEASERCIDRIRFRGLHLQAVPIHRKLISRFPIEPYYRNELAVTYLLINRLADAKKVLEETLRQWPNDGFAQVHYGFILKNLDKNLESAVNFLWKGIKSEENGTQDGRFYFNLGDALQRLGRSEEATQVYRKGAEKKLFLSEYQRSLYNVDNLRGQPFWTKEQTTYAKYFNELEKNWEKIREEGLNALNEKGYFIDESESLKDFGDWKQFELFARGHRNQKNCKKAPFSCALIESFSAARLCKRGQTKFSVMHPGTHVWPHCGPTNCRIRAHLGLKVPPGTKIRVAREQRTWEEGKFLIFDDSFEHEVWHNGTDLRLVLIIDVWHPELTEQQRNSLSPI